MDYDVFISHASEDKQLVARPLAERLRELGIRIWLDEFELTLGDSLRENIDRGLSQSKFGIVVLSKDFFRKEWPQRELDALISKEGNNQKVILPIWHNITRDEVLKFSPILAGKLAATTEHSIEHIVQQVLRALNATITPAANSIATHIPQAEPQINNTRKTIPNQPPLKRLGSFPVAVRIMLLITILTAIIVSLFLFLSPEKPIQTPEELEEEVLVNPKEAILQGCTFDALNYVYCEVFNNFPDRIITKIEVEIKIQTPDGPRVLRPQLELTRSSGAPLMKSSYSYKWPYDPRSSSLYSKDIKVTVRKTNGVF